MSAPSDQTPVTIHGKLDANSVHDLNQPLTAILGNAQAARRFIREGEISRDELSSILDDIISDTMRTAGMIRNLQAHRPTE